MFYTIIIKSDSQAVNRYDSINAAEAAFHTEMAYAYTADVTTTCLIVDATGKRLKLDSYVKPEPIPEQDEEPVEEEPGNVN